MTLSRVIEVSKRVKFLLIIWQGIPPISGFGPKVPLCKSQLTPNWIGKLRQNYKLISWNVPFQVPKFVFPVRLVPSFYLKHYGYLLHVTKP